MGQGLFGRILEGPKLFSSEYGSDQSS